MEAEKIEIAEVNPTTNTPVINHKKKQDISQNKLNHQVEKILLKKPSLASDDELRVLFSKLQRLEKKRSKTYWEIGKVVDYIVKARPEQTVAERKNLFDNELGLSYHTAMNAKRVYLAYKKSPEEIEEYGLDTADRLKDFSKKWRRRIWEETGSQAAVKEHLRELEEYGRTVQSTIKIKSSDKSRKLGDGTQGMFFKGCLTLRINRKPKIIKEVFKALEKTTGTHFEIVSGK
ncbi:MAG: hypothetical protein FVQ80_14920 [Planctomycetes bacterium]|nr:hypothetical protein [Planctomycetota bacterium]